MPKNSATVTFFALASGAHVRHVMCTHQAQESQDTHGGLATLACPPKTAAAQWKTNYSTAIKSLTHFLSLICGLRENTQK